jgi:hypothetical protein
MLTVLLSREFAPHSGAGNLMRSWFRLGAAITSATARSAGCRHAQNRTQARTMARHTACANGMRDRSEDGVRGLIAEHLNNSFGRFQRLVRIGNTSSRKKGAAVTGAGRCPFASPTSGIPIAGLRTCGGNPTRRDLVPLRHWEIDLPVRD